MKSSSNALRPKQTQGQSLTEALLWLPLILITIWGGLRLGQSFWIRIQCAHMTFSIAHEAIHGSQKINTILGGPANPKFDQCRVILKTTPTGKKAIALNAHEEFELPTLENSQW